MSSRPLNPQIIYKKSPRIVYSAKDERVSIAPPCECMHVLAAEKKNWLPRNLPRNVVFLFVLLLMCVYYCCCIMGNLGTKTKFVRGEAII